MNESYIGLRSDLLKYVTQKNCTVLDVGCATGVNGKWLIDAGIANRVVGVEYDKEMAEHAMKHYAQVFNVDLNRESNLPDLLNDQKFDYIILGDILEHLIDPWNALKKLKEVLAPNGKIILSIPNIGHIDTFIHVFIKGYWPYNSRGIFDKTHLRFFTLKNINNLIKDADLVPQKIERKFRYRDAMNSKFPFYGPVLKRLFTNLYTFQYIVVCNKNTKA